MSTKTLTTKLFIPPIRKGYVHRQRLTNRLNQGVDGKLTLVSGPAGFGKTALLSNWVSGVKRPVGWISLDVGDNDKDRFSLYLIKAFQKISDGFANEVLEMLYSAKPLTSDVFLPYFIHQITEIQEPFLIVLDDYHIITKPEIHDLILTILENQPQKMHLVISTRSDPPWPLARWRAQGELSEIRTQDLRFILNETSTCLN
jgi:LuxR family maltose regulon positive regulatory protein